MTNTDAREGGTAMTDWRARALCRDEDPELFFPIGTSGPALLQIAEAKAVCARCPVRAECLAEAQEIPVSGIWGGTTEGERRAFKRWQYRMRAQPA